MGWWPATETNFPQRTVNLNRLSTEEFAALRVAPEVACVALLRLLSLPLQAFIDREGSVVLCFDRAAAAAEGDLTSYLNHQEKHGSTMVEFK